MQDLRLMEAVKQKVIPYSIHEIPLISSFLMMVLHWKGTPIAKPIRMSSSTMKMAILLKKSMFDESGW